LSRRGFVLVVVLVIGALAMVACGDSGAGSADEWDVPGFDQRADFSELDAESTQAEIVRLVYAGHVRYRRTEIMNSGGVYSQFPQEDGTDPGCEIVTFGRPQVPESVCLNYPERIVRELWDVLDSTGMIRTVYGKEWNMEGELLATGSYGEWTDVESGESWGDGTGMGQDPSRLVGIMEDSVERLYKIYDNLVEGEILGRPSLIVPEGEFEYQIANPLITRQTRWQEREDGTTYMLSEGKTVAFEMLPPGSFPMDTSAVE